MSEHREPIPSMLYNAAVGGHVTNSQQIIDENLNREQNDINQEIVGAVPYNSTTPNGMGRIVLKKTDNFKQVVEAQTNGNTIFVIKYDFTLTGDVTVPANCILEFDGGSLRNKVVYLNNYNKIIGNGKLIITDNAKYTFRPYVGEPVNKIVGFVVEGKHDVYIHGITIEYEYPENRSLNGPFGVLCYGLRENPVKNVIIEKCNFNECGVTFWNNTEDSKVIFCDFNGSNQCLFRNETTYDYEGKDEDNPNYNGWKCCKNNVFAYNNVKNTLKNAAYHLMWCTGIDGLDIIYNNFEVCSTLLYLYVSDWNVSLNKANFSHNNVILKDYEGRNVTTVSVMDINGLSFNNPQDGYPADNKTQKSNCLVEYNQIKCEWSDYDGTKFWTAIYCAFIDECIIRQNIIDGFINSIFSNNIRTQNDVIKMSLMKGHYLIEENLFKNYWDRPIKVADNVLSFIIKANTFETSIKRAYSFYDKCFIDTAAKINITLFENKVLVPNGFELIKTKDSQDVPPLGFIISKENVDKDGNLFNGTFFDKPNELCIQTGKTRYQGSLSDVWHSGNIIGRNIHIGQIILSDTYIMCVTKDGVFYGNNPSYPRNTAVLAANNANTNEVEYVSNNGIVPGNIIQLPNSDDVLVDYTILNIYTKVQYEEFVNGNYVGVVSKNVFVLNKPLAANVVSGTSVEAVAGEIKQITFQ